MSADVYLNGRFLPVAQATVSVLDRGFLFGDGVYEVIPVYGARLFRLEPHLQRLDRSLEAIHISNPLAHTQWRQVLETLVERNGGGDQSLYLQITRGSAPKRDHAFPREPNPTVFAMSEPLQPPARELYAHGIRAALVEDIRWRRCDIKSIALLPNIMLRQQAVEQGAAEAIMVRDGQVTEGAASNVFALIDGQLLTPPTGRLLLPGITRDLVVELCREAAIPCLETPFGPAELAAAQEIWITSSTREVVAVTHLDGRPVGDGNPGPLWQRVIDLYRDYKQAVRDGRRS